MHISGLVFSKYTIHASLIKKKTKGKKFHMAQIYVLLNYMVFFFSRVIFKEVKSVSKEIINTADRITIIFKF